MIAGASPGETSHVYVISAPDGSFKVGFATSPTRRLADLQHASRATLSLVKSISVPKSAVREVERHAHWLLRDKHARGEWFACSSQEAVAAVEAAWMSVQAGTTGEERKRHRDRGAHRWSCRKPKSPTAVRLDRALVAEVRERTKDLTATVEEGLRLWLAREAERTSGREHERTGAVGAPSRPEKPG